jgi:hypothetical protein
LRTRSERANGRLDLPRANGANWFSTLLLSASSFPLSRYRTNAFQRERLYSSALTVADASGILSGCATIHVGAAWQAREKTANHPTGRRRTVTLAAQPRSMQPLPKAPFAAARNANGPV